MGRGYDLELPRQGLMHYLKHAGMPGRCLDNITDRDAGTAAR